MAGGEQAPKARLGPASSNVTGYDARFTADVISSVQI